MTLYRCARECICYSEIFKKQKQKTKLIVKKLNLDFSSIFRNYDFCIDDSAE